MLRLALCALLALLAAPVGATTARWVDLPNLVHRADTVVRGHVTGQTSFWQQWRIYTLAHVTVDEAWTGHPPATLDVLTLGGTVGNLGQRVDGAAVLPVGHDVVVSLRASTPGEYEPVAMAQGVWLVGPAGVLSTPVDRPYIDRLVTLQGGTQAPMPSTLDALKAAVLAAANHAP